PGANGTGETTTAEAGTCESGAGEDRPGEGRAGQGEEAVVLEADVSFHAASRGDRTEDGMKRPGSRLLVMMLAAAALWAQARLSVDQLFTFVQSSIRLKHPDRQVAAYLSKLKLSERLELRTVEELEGLGAGPATVDALRK